MTLNPPNGFEPIPDPNPQPSSLGEQIGLGRAWSPGPAGWDWMQARDPMGRTVYVLKLHTLGGVTGIMLVEEDLRTFIANAQEQLTGLTIATEIVSNHGQG